MFANTLSRILNLDPFAARSVAILSLVWFVGCLQVLSSVFTLKVVPDSIDIENTVQGSFGIGKDQSYLLPLSTTILFFGWLFGSSILSAYSDRNGRRIAFIWSFLILALGQLTQIAAWNFFVFLFGRFISGFGIGGNGVISYVWGSEWLLPMNSPTSDNSEHPDIPKRDTTLASALFQIQWSLGGVILPLFALLIPYWRSLFTFLLTIGFCVCLIVILVVPESPKWLLSNGFSAQYHKLCENVDDFNEECGLPSFYRRRAPENDSLDDEIPILVEDEPPLSVEGSPLFRIEETPQNSFFKKLLKETWKPIAPLFKVPLLFTTLLLAVIWFSNAFLYYGLSLNANGLPGNIYSTTCLLSLLAIPGQLCAIPATRFMGVKKSMYLSMIATGVVFKGCALISLLISREDRKTPILLLTLLAQFFETCAFSLCYMITAAAYETKIRNMGVGFCVTMARFGAMASPVVTLIGDQSHGSGGSLIDTKGLILLGSIGIIAGFCAKLLPLN